jgi:uncharacterized protein
MRAIAALAAMTLLVVGCQGGNGAWPAGPSDPPRTVPMTAPSPSAPPSPTPTPLTHQRIRRDGNGGLAGLAQQTLNARLIGAARNNNVARARRLIVAGANVNAKDETEQSAYLISTSEGYLRLLDLTLRHGANVHSKDSFNGTGLIRAAERGHADIVARLLQTDVKVDHVNELGWTALHEAIILGTGNPRYVETVRLLVAAGADVDLPSRRDGVRPLQHARSKGFEEIAATLRKADRAKRLDRPGATARLLDAARRGNPDMAAVALRAGARLEARDHDRRTPMLLAAIRDHVDVARLLVHLGADPDALDDRHDSAWLVTGVTGSVRMAETLLPAHPDLALTNRYGGTSLIPASERGHVHYVRRVVNTGIDVNHVNNLGWTALLEAVILGDGSRPYQRIVRILLDAGADPTIADSEGVTPLQHAQSRRHNEIARMLHGAMR